MPVGIYERTEIHSKNISNSLKGHPNWGFQKGEGYWIDKKFSKKHKENLKKAKLGKLQPNISKALKGIIRSIESRNKQSKSISCENHWNWQGGTPIIINKNYTNYRWKKLRLKILTRDNYQCFLCKKIFESKNLIVHHKEKYKVTKNNEMINLITVCRSCHLKKINNLHLKDNNLLKE